MYIFKLNLFFELLCLIIDYIENIKNKFILFSKKLKLIYFLSIKIYIYLLNLIT